MVKIKVKIKRPYFSFFAAVFVLFTVFLYASYNIDREIKTFLTKETGQNVDVSVIPNQETKKGDVYIKIKSSPTPSKDKNIFITVLAMGKLMEQSISYQIYLGVVMIDIDNSLYAISAENCRKIFLAKNQQEQNSLLQKNLKRLK